MRHHTNPLARLFGLPSASCDSDLSLGTDDRDSLAAEMFSVRRKQIELERRVTNAERDLVALRREYHSNQISQLLERKDRNAA